MNIKSVFSIKDLENISGIKAHTIRMWEKRYGILEPQRTDTNIRLYDIANLQKLLNITLLHEHGYKISKISRFPSEKIPTLVKDIVYEKSKKSHAINAFKMAMFNFDQALFKSTYEDLLAEKPFSEVFHEVFIPLLEEIGILWQTGTITPSHEHFISYLIRQKLIVNTEKKQDNPIETNRPVYVLFLPENEIHELALLYLNYELVQSGNKTIYIGQSIPLENLQEFPRYFEKIIYISHWTVAPDIDQIPLYIKALTTELQQTNSDLWLFGRQASRIKLEESSRIKIFSDIKDIQLHL